MSRAWAALTSRWVLGLVAAAAAGWWLDPLQTAPQTVARPLPRDAWELPSLPSRAAGGTLAATVSVSPLWGVGGAKAAPAGASAAPVEDPRWRIAAVYGLGDQRGALVSFMAPGRPPQRVKVGDALPSGHTIVSIGERDVCIRVGQKILRLGVERIE